MGFITKDVRGDGSCFFRAIYNSIQFVPLENRIKVFKCFKVTDMDVNEDTFLKLARKRLSQMILEKKDFGIIYAMYKNLKSYAKEDFKIITSGFPVWFKTRFKSANFDKLSKAKFRGIILKEILV